MPPGNGMRLLQVADREFRQLSSKPAPIAPTRKIKAIIVLVGSPDTAAQRSESLRRAIACLSSRVWGDVHTIRIYDDQ